MPAPMPTVPSPPSPPSLHDVAAPSFLLEEAPPEPQIGSRGMRQMTMIIILAGLTGFAIGWFVISVWLG